MMDNPIDVHLQQQQQQQQHQPARTISTEFDTSGNKKYNIAK